MSYSLNNSKATSRRVDQLKLSDAQVNDSLLTNKGRKSIGYNYLVSNNLSQEIGYDKEGKTYNRSYGPNRAERRSNR
tara:strand:+ start:261 stop:491 length:231 start_codon:yes stop_codon:yes gene_type:complete